MKDDSVLLTEEEIRELARRAGFAIQEEASFKAFWDAVLLHVRSYGNYTVALLLDTRNVPVKLPVVVAAAKRNPIDRASAAVGQSIAIRRCLSSAHDWWVSREIEKYLGEPTARASKF